MGGLLALKRGEAHLAGTHLLDEETGEYNVSYLKKLLPEKKVVLVNLVYRTQGFVVPQGNPKTIRGFEDLARGDVVFVNRQAGAGTRLLTDLHLKRLGIDPSRVKGYDHEEYTHMAVAAAVLSGAADTGLAVLSAAQALGLGFVPVAQERYDLAIPQEFYDGPLLQTLLGIIRDDPGFRQAILGMGGYDVSDMGKVVGVVNAAFS
jgi:putative molybdopterin biosynthesis protein